jgi:SAM-dependent methyltransferase
MDARAMAPFGKALMDWHRGERTPGIVNVLRDDGWTTTMAIGGFFRNADDLAVERTALTLCKGRVLDSGAGSGIHSLFLQQQGFEVSAIDILPEAVEIMHESGVRDARLADIFNLAGEHFDTIIMMGHGIGVVENLYGLGRFLEHAKELMEPDGQVLLTSTDIRTWTVPDRVSYVKKNRDSGKYAGEIRMRFGYKDTVGSYFTWLHVDPETLHSQAAEHGWNSELLDKDTEGNYLARITLLV